MNSDEKDKDKIDNDIYRIICNFSRLQDNDKRQISRLDSPDKLRNLPLYYNILASSGILTSNIQFLRMIYLLAFIKKDSDDKRYTIGKAIAKKINTEDIEKWEKRICYLLRLKYPKDIIQLRRMIQHLEITNLNMKSFGDMLYFGERKLNKRYYRTLSSV
jgi:CRISPR system Cascade subunit CasB